MAFVDNLRGAGEPVSDAELADVLETTIWEKIKQGASRRRWRSVAEEFVEQVETEWPSKLCSFEQAEQIGVEIEIEALIKRFERLAKKKSNMSRLREKALKIITRSGQVVTPADGMTLWQYFKPEQNTIINKGSLAAKEASIESNRKAARKRSSEAAKAQAAPAPPAPSPAAPAPAAETPTDKTATAEQTLDDLLRRQLPWPTVTGLCRGAAAGIGKRKGKGGAIQDAFKVGISQLVTEDSVPIRDVPKVLLDMIVVLTQQVPKDADLITHSHIRDWIVAQGAGSLYDDWTRFWEMRRQYGALVVLHIGHDGTRRCDRKLGKHAELMQLLASYFDPSPEVNRAVEFVISMRFTVGGSAEHTARAIAVNLADAGVYRVSASLDALTAMKVTALQKGVLFDLGADNTGSAVNISKEIEMLSGEPCGLWPCPTHITALDSKTPLLALTGDAGTDFNAPNALNISPKWCYLCDKHGEVISSWWPLLKCIGNVRKAMVIKKPLMGKWESVGDAANIIVTNIDSIRTFVTSMEYYATGMTGVGSLKLDCQLLTDWLHDAQLWFHYLIQHDWFLRYMDPIFHFLRAKGKIHPESGPHMGGQMIPRLAFDSVGRAYDLPDATCTDAVIDAKLKKYLPNAHRHIHLGIDSQVGARNGFRIPTADRQAYCRAWATKFTPRLRLNAENHWRGYLQGWKFAGLVTDPELGSYVARMIIKLLSGSAALGGEPRALGTNLLGANLQLQLAELDALILRDGGGIASALTKEGLFNSEARKAEWVKLCDPTARAVLPSVFWTRDMLPELCPWWESRFFGRHRTNYPLESTFSVYGQRVEGEQAMDLKEAIVRLTKALPHEKDARRSPEVRVPKKSAKAQARYEQEAADRVEEGKSEELERDSVSRKQLVMCGESLLARMLKANEAEDELCPEIGKRRGEFLNVCKLSWEMLSKREANLLVAEMKAPRARPNARARLTQDPFERRRKQLAVLKSAAYLAQAAAANKAEEAAAAAVAAAQEVILPDGDASDEDLPASGSSSEPFPKKKKAKVGRGKKA